MRVFPGGRLLSYALPALLTLSFVIPLLSGCATQKTVLVAPLFFSMREITITPVDDGSGSDAGNISEKVEYVNRAPSRFSARREKQYDQDASKLDTTASYLLSEVRVKAQSAYTTERDGKLQIAFAVNLPKEVLSTKWRLLLTPEMRYADTVVDLPKMQIKGFEFETMQREGYKKWEEYLASIVDKKDYDKHFVDSAGVNSDIARLQQFFFEQYDHEVKEYNKYLARKKQLEQQALNAGIKSEIKKREKYLEQIRQNDFDQVARGGGKLNAEGEIEPVMPVFNSEWRPKTIPKKYMDILENAERTSSSVNRQDSLLLVSRRYKMNEIVQNEMKDSMKSAVFADLVPYPYLDGLHLDTTAGSIKDIRYIYKTEYPYKPGMTTLRLTLKGSVDAIDRSSFVLPPGDTLTMTISTMDQLFDTTLVHKRTKVYRNVFANLTLHPKYNKGGSDFDVNFAQNRSIPDTIISSWKSYRERGFQIDSVEMTTSTSLEGNYDKNMELTQKRVASLKAYLEANAPAEMRVGSTFRANHIGEDWAGLLRMVRRSSTLGDVDGIVNTIVNASNPDATEASFKDGLSQADYRILRNDIYPTLDKVDLVYYLSYPGLQSADSVIVEQRPDYARAVKLFNNREYWEAMDILSNYPDYNLALCMVILGFNDRAYDLLQMLDQTANTEYLLAIVSYRMNNKSDATTHLLKACELDPNKVYRAYRDPDMKELIAERKLSDRLTRIQQGLK